MSTRNTEWAADELDAEATPGEIEAAPEPDVFRVMLAERAFNVAEVPPRPVPVLSLAGHCIGTPGNLVALQAGIKSGKTAAIGGTNAAFFLGDTVNDRDTLGFTASNPEGHAALHFDTEQSRFDHDGTIRRALTRAGIEEPPEWFRSFSLADVPQGNRVLCLETAVADALADFGGIRAVILDGVADFVRDPNDPEEAFSFVDTLHREAIRLDCLIVAVIHENPGSDAGKTRGHLGSQLARKAETNLRLAKDTGSGITTVWADFARHCHISKDDGVCFAWSESLGMHVSKGTARTIKADEKREKFREEVEGAFGDAAALPYGELCERIEGVTGHNRKTAEKRVKTYSAEGLIVKNPTGTYSPT